jgi:general secretion pathway protein A
MYRAFFGLKANPFNVNPDPRYLFLTRHTREALACMTYGVKSRKGFVLLTGEVGTGKTTLLNQFLKLLREQHEATAFIFNPRLEVNQFLRYMMTDFGIPCPALDKGEMLLRLNQWLLGRYRMGKTAVLIVDEAQSLSVEMLEEIRLLTNLETVNEKLLQIVLAGQPELELKIKTPELRQLSQRISLRCKTFALTPEETCEYIAQRMRQAGGGEQQVFTTEAMECIARYSGGIPRLINLICEHALIAGFADQEHEIAAPAIEEIAREFELDESMPGIPMDQELDISVLQAMKSLVADLRAARAIPAVPKETKI